MAIEQVVAVSPEGARKKMVKSAFDRVWSARGWRLASEVDAEQAAAPETADAASDAGADDAGEVEATVPVVANVPMASGGILTPSPGLRGAPKPE